MKSFSLKTPITLGILLVLGLTSGIYAQANDPNALMPKCFFLSTINDLGLKKDQLQAMADVTAQIEKEREAAKVQRDAVLQPFYQKLVSGEQVDMEEIHDAMMDMPKPEKGNRMERRKQMETLWAMLSPDQQETLREMEMPMRGNMHKGMQGGHGMMNPDPEGMEPPEGPPEGMPFEGRLDMNSPDAPDTALIHFAAQTTTADDKPMPRMKDKKGKRDPGMMNLMHLLGLPGADEALRDRLTHM